MRFVLKSIKSINFSNKFLLTQIQRNNLSTTLIKLEMSDSNSPKKETLALPSTEDVDNSAPKELQIDQTIKLEELGPMVVNEDGTMSRVNNWSEMTEFEKKSFNRLILKRNKERLEKLKAMGVKPN
jgi:hypothetical protein